jgi:class 3 adenylate cyclase
VLASAALVNRLELPFAITKRPLGDLRLRGKESDVVLYALEKERTDSAAAAA